MVRVGLGQDYITISVLLTGAGKSILSLLLAVLRKEGISIVIVLFMVLIDNIVTRAVAIGVYSISCPGCS